SGILRSGVSFAIPADKVKEFLAKPALVLNKPELRYADRNKAALFEIEVFATRPEAMPDALAIEYSLAGRSATKAPAQTAGEKFTFQATPFADKSQTSSHKVQLLVYTTSERRVRDVADAQVHLGKSAFWLSELRLLERRADTWIGTTLTGERLAGPL